MRDCFQVFGFKFNMRRYILGAEGSIFRSPYPPALLLQLVGVKLAATALCRQSGLVGGVYAPSLFMGAALGSAYGAALVPLALAGAPVAPPPAYALVGMAGVLAGICRVPLTVGAARHSPPRHPHAC